jgi:hypothetical protein
MLERPHTDNWVVREIVSRTTLLIIAKLACYGAGVLVGADALVGASGGRSWNFCTRFPAHSVT